MARGRKKIGFVMISVVAERYDIHPQTLRMYEREGLLQPTRSEGNTRLYDEEALKRLEGILTLTRDMGVNLAGVEIILKLRDELELAQREQRKLRRLVERELAEGKVTVTRRHALVRLQSGPLVKRED